MRDDVTGLHIPMGSNPGTELNNLFVMNINSEETDSYCRESEAEVQVETRSTIKGEGKKGLLTTNPSVPFTSYDVHPTCTVSPLSVSLSFFLSLAFLHFPKFPTLPPLPREKIARGFQSLRCRLHSAISHALLEYQKREEAL
ncbi:hypothetical protein EAG_01547 [Camponotus floridanus]|uniref:Uncharacterized protein n=1 Tax=Camponotus floridanus TaxID=104421 RepID=E2AVT5_CAMFO|nr:hypothetical protein EAG_01547 [Camponotus floridanus]